MSYESTLAMIESLILGESLAIRQLRDRIGRVAGTGLAVMIEGPTGTGKELVAAALHRASGRRGEFVATNVCAIAEGMFESTLFGHRRGSFTGAVQDHKGLLSEAHDGTLFLDEIGELSLAAQVKLLRALETGSYRPIGSRGEQTSRFRIVAASNTPLEALIHAGLFRRDLAERLRGMRLRVPRLTDRGGDAKMLANHFAAQRQCSLTADATQFVQRFEWPGNVRQLRNTIDCASHLCIGTEIDAATLAECLQESLGDPSPADVTPHNAEDERTINTVREYGGSVDQAAAALGLHRATVYRRLARIERECSAGA